MRADFYVYALFRENGHPFYIGKGCGERWKAHDGEGRKKKKFNRYKNNVIKNMRDAGIEIPRIKLAEGLTEPQAFEIEAIFIKAIGRYPNGPLTNRSDGGEGAAGIDEETRRSRSDALVGHPVSHETRLKISIGRKAYFVNNPEALKLIGNRNKRTQREKDKIAASLRELCSDPAQKEKLAAQMRGRKLSAETRDIKSAPIVAAKILAMSKNGR